MEEGKGKVQAWDNAVAKIGYHLTGWLQMQATAEC